MPHSIECSTDVKADLSSCVSANAMHNSCEGFACIVASFETACLISNYAYTITSRLSSLNICPSHR